jgi:hypothetical protein
MPQEWGVLEVSAQLRWRQGQLLAKLPDSEGITEQIATLQLASTLQFILPVIPGGYLPGIKGQQKGPGHFRKSIITCIFHFPKGPERFYAL